MKSVRVTEREILNSMLNGTITHDMMVEYAKKKLIQLDKRNQVARARAAKKRPARDELTELIFSILTYDPMSREDVLEIVQETNPEATIGKIGYRLTALTKEIPPQVIKQEATFENEQGQLKKITVYSLKN